jgi:hypothetical protein
MSQRYICKECWARLEEKEVLFAPNPFDPSSVILGCPKCKAVQEMVPVCDEPGCWESVCCGTPMPLGEYRSTCHKHVPVSPAE